MFETAIEEISKFTRPIHIISRSYGNKTLIPGTATLFFVNDKAEAITCKHVAVLIAQSDMINTKYKEFSDQIKGVGKKHYKKKLKEAEQKFGLKSGMTVQIKNVLVGCVDNFTKIEIIMHEKYDIAIVKLLGYKKILYEGHAKFLKNDQVIKQGKSLCRLGYPFPEFTNYILDDKNDDITWTKEGRLQTPQFPIDGIVTRQILGDSETPVGIEMSTPGLKGQSGGPLFDKDGIIYGMQSQTHHLHLGFDIKEKEILVEGKKKKVSNYPFLHLGNSVRVNIIKDFLKSEGISFEEI